MKQPDLLTIAQAAKLIGITRQAVRKAVDAGRIPSVPITVKVERITRAAAEGYKQTRKAK